MSPVTMPTNPIMIEAIMMELNFFVKILAVAWGMVSNDNTSITPETLMLATIASALRTISR